jgi:hypothetical protein
MSTTRHLRHVIGVAYEELWADDPLTHLSPETLAWLARLEHLHCARPNDEVSDAEFELLASLFEVYITAQSEDEWYGATLRLYRFKLAVEQAQRTAEALS